MEVMLIEVNGRKRMYVGHTPDPDILMFDKVNKDSIKFFEVDEIYQIIIG